MRRLLKKYYDRIDNEKLKMLILQALPFWLASVIAGLVAVGYARIFALAERSALYLSGMAHWSVFVVTPLCFVLSVWVVKKFAPAAKGSGIPQVMVALDHTSPKNADFIDRLLNLRVAIVKIISSCLMALGGAVIGREGPTIQIAASIFRKINGWLPPWWPKISRNNMIMTGAAAGLAAAFNTPLGGIVFAMEELAKNHLRFYRTAILTAVIIAGLTAQGILGPYLYIGYPDIRTNTYWLFIPVVVVSLVAGSFAAVSCRMILRIIRWKKNLTREWQTWAFVVLCAFVVAAIAFFTDFKGGLSGREIMITSLFTEEKYMDWYMPLVRAAGSVVSFTTGAAGGVFAPALSTGACTGSVIAQFFSLTDGETNMMILAGMVAFLTGITRSPFTSAILVLEMTDGHNGIFYLMLAALISNISAYTVDRHSLYEHLKKEYRPQGAADRLHINK